MLLAARKEKLNASKCLKDIELGEDFSMQNLWPMKED